jgi:hypothetical protein
MPDPMLLRACEASLEGQGTAYAHACVRACNAPDVVGVPGVEEHGGVVEPVARRFTTTNGRAGGRVGGRAAGC